MILNKLMFNVALAGDSRIFKKIKGVRECK